MFDHFVGLGLKGLTFDFTRTLNIKPRTDSVSLMKGSEREEEAATRVVVYKKVFFKIPKNSQENIFVGLSFLINFIEKEAPTRVFSFKFYGGF